MIEKQTFEEWMRDLGWEWNPGREQLFKGEMIGSEAEALINELYQRGDIRRV